MSRSQEPSISLDNLRSYLVKFYSDPASYGPSSIEHAQLIDLMTTFNSHVVSRWDDIVHGEVLDWGVTLLGSCAIILNAALLSMRSPGKGIEVLSDYPRVYDAVSPVLMRCFTTFTPATYPIDIAPDNPNAHRWEHIPLSDITANRRFTNRFTYPPVVYHSDGGWRVRHGNSTVCHYKKLYPNDSGAKIWCRVVRK